MKFIYPFNYLSIYLSIYPFIYLSIYLSEFMMPAIMTIYLEISPIYYPQQQNSRKKTLLNIMVLWLRFRNLSPQS